MKVTQSIWTRTVGWSGAPTVPNHDVQLVFVFGSRDALCEGQRLGAVRTWYPAAKLVGCSTSGEIQDVRVVDDSVVATAVEFQATETRLVFAPLAGANESDAVGRQLATRLLTPELVHVFVLSDGLQVNASQLVAGFADVLPPHVALTGGLSGDGERFERTVTIADDAPVEGRVVAVGFYGDRLRVGYGSHGGWDQFGPSRTVTRSLGSVLYELDGEPALAVYRRYLGEHADALPGSALLFPLSLAVADGGESVVRTVLAIDPATQSMTFAGDMPQGARARFMMANFERLIDCAGIAARDSGATLGAPSELAVLISCVGRKLILGQRVEEEVEGVRATLGPGPVLSGFYSYGEISPAAPGADCRLQNQTMTVTTFREE